MKLAFVAEQLHANLVLQSEMQHFWSSGVKHTSTVDSKVMKTFLQELLIKALCNAIQ